MQVRHVSGRNNKGQRSHQQKCDVRRMDGESNDNVYIKFGESSKGERKEIWKN